MTGFSATVRQIIHRNSLDINRYDTRCVSCHKRFDLDFIDAVTT